MNALKQKRGVAKSTLTRAVEFITSIEQLTSLETLEIRLNRVIEAWQEFTKLHYECLPLVEEGEVEEFNNDFGVYENKYFEAHAGLTVAIRQRQANQTSNNSVLERIAKEQSAFLNSLDSSAKAPAKINLPPIVIPKFSGDYKDWPSFRDLFLGSVDIKENLSSTHKFQYLKSFLSGTAADLVQHIKVSDANYTEAWDRLEKRFDRGNLVVQSFVQSYLSLPTMNAPNAQTLRKITDGADEVIRGLNALSKNNRDPWLIYILLNKLDSETKQAWAKEVGAREDMTITSLIEFLEQRCDALESCQPLNRSSTSRGKQASSIRALVAKPVEGTSQCPMCKSNHSLYQCTKFLELDIPSRRNFTKTNVICFNCLRLGHSVKKCRSTFRCRVCKARHHYLVHIDDSNDSAPVATSSTNTTSTPSSSSAVPENKSNTKTVEPLVSNLSREFSLRKHTVLPTILAKLENNLNQLIDVRVLLDTGSASSLITEALVQKLGLRRTHSRIPLLGIGSTEAGHTKGVVSLTLMSRYNSTHLTVDAHILGNLTTNLPSKSFDISTWDYLSNLDLADPLFNVSDAVDIILGADKVWSILKSEQIVGPQGKPIAQNTSFGWVISGGFVDSTARNEKLSSFHSTVDVDALLQRFWELEHISSHNSFDAVNDPAEKHNKLLVALLMENTWFHFRLKFLHQNLKVHFSLRFQDCTLWSVGFEIILS